MINQKRNAFHEKIQSMLTKNLKEKITFSFKEIDGKLFYCFEKRGHENAVLAIEDDPKGIFIVLNPNWIETEETITN